jgi:3-hydroxyethyl bacteriochlorophyllide a dehydrogenase
LDTLAVVFEEPNSLSLRRLGLSAPSQADVVVEVRWSGISTGTERLLWTGRMPPFPGLGYPLVPGYEAVGTVVEAGALSGRSVGDMVYIAGSTGFIDARGLFGASARRLVVPAAKTTIVDPALDAQGVLFALAATAYHALGDGAPELIIGHGALGRLVARLAMLRGVTPTVWEKNPVRRGGATGYPVIDASEDPRRDYRTICDVSGDASILDTLVMRLQRGGELVLAGFYDTIQFSFPMAFIKEIRVRIAAEWAESDLIALAALANSGRLSLDGLITHRLPAADAAQAYATAFGDPECVKMVLDWRDAA